MPLAYFFVCAKCIPGIPRQPIHAAILSDPLTIAPNLLGLYIFDIDFRLNYNSIVTLFRRMEGRQHDQNIFIISS